MKELEKINLMLNIIDFLARQPEPTTLYRVAKEFDIAPEQARRMLAKLVEDGFVKKIDGRYTAEPKSVYVYNGVVLIRVRGEEKDATIIIGCPYYETCWHKKCMTKECQLLRELPAPVKLWVLNEEK